MHIKGYTLLHYSWDRDVNTITLRMKVSTLTSHPLFRLKANVLEYRWVKKEKTVKILDTVLHCKKKKNTLAFEKIPEDISHACLDYLCRHFRNSVQQFSKHPCTSCRLLTLADATLHWQIMRQRPKLQHQILRCTLHCIRIIMSLFYSTELWRDIA